MRILFMTVMIFVASLLELWCGNWGIWLPFVSGGVFYFTVAYHWRFGLIAAWCGGMVLEALYQRNTWLALAMLGVWALGWGWTRAKQSTALAAAIFPGFLIGLISGVPLLLWQGSRVGWRWESGLTALAFVFFAMLFMAAWLPLSIRWLDGCAERLGLPLYRNREE